MNGEPSVRDELYTLSFIMDTRKFRLCLKTSELLCYVFGTRSAKKPYRLFLIKVSLKNRTVCIARKIEIRTGNNRNKLGFPS